MPHSGLAVTLALGLAEQNRVIEALIDVAAAAFHVADDGEDAGGETIAVPRTSMDALSAALDVLDELPDDQPGYVMEGPAKARWALRALLARTDPCGVREGS